MWSILMAHFGSMCICHVTLKTEEQQSRSQVFQRGNIVALVKVSHAVEIGNL